MSAKYNFSIRRNNVIKGFSEELQIINCDSFDEARRIVEKAVVDRELFETEELKKRSPKAAVSLNQLPEQSAPNYNGSNDTPDSAGDKLPGSDNPA